LDSLTEQLKKIVKEMSDSVSLMEDLAPSLLSGSIGSYLFLFLSAKTREDGLQSIEDGFSKHLIRAINNPKPTLTDGVSGVGWLLQILINNEVLESDGLDHLLLEIDSLVYNYALEQLKTDNHDFLYGPVGEMVYLVSRVNENPEVKVFLAEISGKLIGIGEQSENGSFWFESKFLLEENQKASEVINLGISHGLASKIIMLSKLVELEINTGQNARCLESCVKYLLYTKKKGGISTLFPSMITKGEYSKSSFWWSYGDLGAGIALWRAGIALNNDYMKSEAISVFEHYKDVTIEESSIYEPSLCRGSAGIAVMYLTIFRETGVEEYYSIAEYWMKETIGLGIKDNGVTRFEFLNNYSEDSNEWFYGSNPTLLMGDIGVGLAMISFLEVKDSYWESCLLIS
jgi:lantibiotic modifying enzyme